VIFALGARAKEIPLPRPDIPIDLPTFNQPSCTKNRKVVFRQLPHCGVPGYAPLCLDANDPDTVVCAFTKRVLRDVPDHGDLTEFASFVKQYVQRFPKVSVMGFEEWLESTTYNEERKSKLRLVKDSLRGGLPQRKKCSRVNSFVKTEFYPEYKHARMINSRCDEFKVASGPAFKTIERMVYGQKEFIKHVPVIQRPAAIRSLRQHGRRYFATDFTAFESHFKSDILNAGELILYDHCLSDYPALAALIHNVISGENKCRTRSGVKVKIGARRMSGDMCTSLGNGFTNLMLAKFIAFKKGGDIDGFVEGDDGLFSSTVPLTPADYSALGFTIKIEEVLDPCMASFCGIVCGDCGDIVRDPRKFIQGFAWTGSFVYGGNKLMLQLLRAKALSTLFETPGCPIVSIMAKFALDRTVGVVPRFVDDGQHKCPSDTVNVPDVLIRPESRLLVEQLFRIPVGVQLAVEHCIEAGDFAGVSHLLPAPVDVSDYSSKFVERRCL